MNLHKADASRFLSAYRGQEDARLNCYVFFFLNLSSPGRQIAVGQHQKGYAAKHHGTADSPNLLFPVFQHQQHESYQKNHHKPGSKNPLKGQPVACDIKSHTEHCQADKGESLNPKERQEPFFPALRSVSLWPVPFNKGKYSKINGSNPAQLEKAFPCIHGVGILLRQL